MKKTPTKWILLAIMVLAAGTSYSSAQTWQKSGSTYPYINRIIIDNNDPSKVWVASGHMPVDLSLDFITFPNFGRGLMMSKDGGSTFPDTILNDFNVFDIIKSSREQDKMYAAVRKLNRGGIVVSTDNGTSWTDEYSMLGEGPHQFLHIRSIILNDKENFFTSAINTSNGFITTSDGFVTTDNHNNLKIQAHDIEFSQAKPGLVFLAGDHDSQGRVLRSYDNGQTWLEDEEGLTGMRIHCIMPHPTNPAIVLCGADSIDTFKKISIGKGIYISLDTGKTWKLEAARGAQVFDIAMHPSEKRFLAAAAGTQGVFVASQFGLGWAQYKDGLPDNSSARVVAIPNIPSTSEGIVVFAGLFGDGLYKSRNITSSVSEQNAPVEIKLSSAYPQPASSHLSINLDIPADCRADVSLVDMLGNSVLSLRNAQFAKGTNTISFEDLSVCPSGSYLLTVSTPSASAVQRIIIAK